MSKYAVFSKKVGKPILIEVPKTPERSDEGLEGVYSWGNNTWSHWANWTNGTTWTNGPSWYQTAPGTNSTKEMR